MVRDAHQGAFDDVVMLAQQSMRARAIARALHVGRNRVRKIAGQVDSQFIVDVFVIRSPIRATALPGGPAGNSAGYPATSKPMRQSSRAGRDAISGAKPCAD